MEFIEGNIFQVIHVSLVDGKQTSRFMGKIQNSNISYTR
jgi:hypothetical protein